MKVLCHSHKIRVHSFFGPPTWRKAFGMAAVRTVVVGNIDPSVAEERLKGFLSRCGSIRKLEFNAKAVPHRATVEFATGLAAGEALRMSGVEVGGLRLTIARASADLLPPPPGPVSAKKPKPKAPTKSPFSELVGLGLEEPPPPPPPPSQPPAPGMNSLERIATNLRQKIADRERQKELDLQREREAGPAVPSDTSAPARATGWGPDDGAPPLIPSPLPAGVLADRQRLGEKPPTLYISGLDGGLRDEDIAAFLTAECGGPLGHHKIIRDTVHSKHYGFFTFDDWGALHKCLALDGYTGLGRFPLLVSISQSAAVRHPTTHPTSARQGREVSRRASRSRSRSRGRRSPSPRDRPRDSARERANRERGDTRRPAPRPPSRDRGRDAKRTRAEEPGARKYVWESE
jgi:hypothetical protein